MTTPPGDNGTAKAKDLRVLLPFSRDNMRIPDELAGEINDGWDVLVCGRHKGEGKIFSVEVRRDGDGASLGRLWPEFASACGFAAGWVLMLRHRGLGVLTVKAFDDSCCLTELLRAPPADQATMSSTHASRRPQFISVLPQDLTGKMQIPSKFVEQYIPKEDLNKRMAIVVGPLSKVCPVELEMNWPNVFLAKGWSKVLEFHGITEDNSLLLRYEGNMVFTIKVFGPNGCQNKSRCEHIKVQQCVGPCTERQTKPKVSKAPLRKTSLQRESVFNIGPPSWIKKQINANSLKELALARVFCDTIGLRDSCTITLKTSMHSNQSWQMHGFLRKSKSYMFKRGWRKFCQENSLELGDTCTFNVVETTVWHVIITRYKSKNNSFADYRL